MSLAARQSGIVAVIMAFLVNCAMAQQSGSSDASALVDAYNASGLALFKELSTRPGNVVLSPYSIGTAMAMVLVGARGSTEDEMASVLKQTLAPARIADANEAVRATLAGYDKRVRAVDDDRALEPAGGLEHAARGVRRHREEHGVDAAADCGGLDQPSLRAERGG